MTVSKKRTLFAIFVVLVLAVCISVNRISLGTINTGSWYQAITDTIVRTWDISPVELPPSLSCSLSKEVSALTEDDINDIEKFVIFVGYARSGHSIIGSLMDAHPNMVIAHQYMLFSQWITKDIHDKLNGNRHYLFNDLYQESYRASCDPSGLRSENGDFKGYTLFVNNSWQGQFKDLKVIGDKSGGKVGMLYSHNSSQTQNSYREIMTTVEIPIYSLHVVRNPFDVISTTLLYNVKDENGRKYEPTEGSKYNDTNRLERVIHKFLRLAEVVRDMISTCKLTVLEIHSEDFITQPQESMKRICDFLGVECSPWYLQMCQDKVFPSVSRTRDKVEWSEEQKARVQTILNSFPYFKGYNFVRDNYDHS